MRIVVSSLTAAVCLLPVPYARAAADRLETIRAAINALDSRIVSIEGTYEILTDDKPQWLRDAIPKVRYLPRVEYRWAQERKRGMFMEERVCPSSNGSPASRAREVWDGRHSLRIDWSDGKEVNHVTRDLAPPSQLDNGFQLTSFAGLNIPQVRGSLSTLFRRGRPRYLGQELVSGRLCDKIEVDALETQSGGAAVLAAMLDPSQAFLPIRLELRVGSGAKSLVSTAAVSDFARITDEMTGEVVPFPAIVAHEAFLGGRSIGVSQYRLLTAVINGALPVTTFSTEIGRLADGVFVDDRTQKKKYITGNRGDLYDEKFMRRHPDFDPNKRGAPPTATVVPVIAQPPSRLRWNLVLVPILSVALVALGIYLRAIHR